MKKYRFVREYEPLHNRFWYETQERFLFLWVYVSGSGHYNKEKAKQNFEILKRGDKKYTEVLEY